MSKVEKAELANPSPRKLLADRTIYLSYAMPTSYNPPVITDFGAARLGDPGQKYTGDVMPGVFRAPEIIAGMEWDSKVDIWSVGVMVRIINLPREFLIQSSFLLSDALVLCRSGACLKAAISFMP